MSSLALLESGPELGVDRGETLIPRQELLEGPDQPITRLTLERYQMQQTFGRIVALVRQIRARSVSHPPIPIGPRLDLPLRSGKRTSSLSAEVLKALTNAAERGASDWLAHGYAS
jgi:hypothetical protein